MAVQLALLRDALAGGLLRAALAVAEVDGVALDVGDANHGLAQVRGRLEEDFRVRVVGHGAHNGLGAFRRVFALEDARANEDAVHAELHHQGGVRRRRHTARGEVHDRQTAFLRDLLHELVGSLHLLRSNKEFILVHGREHLDLLLDGSRVSDGLDDVARTSFGGVTQRTLILIRVVDYCFRRL